MSEQATTSSRLKTSAGYGLLWLADGVDAAALLLLPAWLLQLENQRAEPGSAIMTGSAVTAAVLVGCDAGRAPRRAGSRATALAAAASALAIMWPLPAVGAAFVLALAISICFGTAARALIRPQPTARLRPLRMLFAWVGIVVTGHVASPTGSAAWSLDVLGMLAPLIAAMLLVRDLVAVSMGRRTSGLAVWGERLEERWTERGLRRLARHGLRPLAAADAPVLYRRVEESAGGGWAWEVRHGQAVVATGGASKRSRAERAASKACFAHTFRPPHGRRPGALYLLAPVSGNPFSVRVTDVGGDT